MARCFYTRNTRIAGELARLGQAMGRAKRQPGERADIEEPAGEYNS